MKKLVLALALGTMLSGSALASEFLFAPIHHYMHHRGPAPIPSGPGNVDKITCWMNPAMGLICITVGMIVIDEVKRAITGPGCATMKPRRSWFGQTPDEPRLWRPLCNWRGSV